MTPILYYQFVVLRYMSRRNPYSRQTFTELRIALESLTQDARCPDFAKRGIHGGIALLSRLAPAPVPHQQ